MRKLNDIVIYQDERFYAAFPSVVTRPDGELLVAFRRAPDRRRFFAGAGPHHDVTHCDPNSHLMMVRSWDNGQSWTPEPELIYAHPFGGSQDPCMTLLKDATVLLTSYLWVLLPGKGKSAARPGTELGVWDWTFTSLGGYIMRMPGGMDDWEGPILPPPYEPQEPLVPHAPVLIHNRGAMTQGRDGTIYWIVTRGLGGTRQGLSLATSSDMGFTWRMAGHLPDPPHGGFNETSLIQTAGGDLVGFVRTEGEAFKDHGVVVRSRDLGRTWEPWKDMGIVGHPYHATHLPDGRVLLVYGYRHKPYGIRARVVDAECTDFSGPEIVIREDGGTGDLGYPWVTVTQDGRALVVYYYNVGDGTRHIAGTFLEV